MRAHRHGLRPRTDVIVANNWTVSTLPNGLRVVVTPISTAQSAAVSLWVGVGSRDETPTTNGLSHYIEHMLFKGTERRPTAAMISEAIEGAGGGLNAFTTKEVTCYWNNLPYERVETGLDVLADMLQHSVMVEAEVERERTVVQQELRRAKDSPGSWVGELISDATYGNQPIGWPIGGTLDTVGQMHRDDFFSHMATHYHPQNAVLSIAGNVEVARVTELAGTLFSAWAPREGVSRDHAKAERPAEYIRIDEREIEQCNLMLAVLGLGRKDPDRYALDIMNTALGRGMSSRLFTEVRERRGLAYSVGSGSSRYRDIGSVSVSAGVTREHQEEALQVILGELNRIATEPMGDEELTRTKDYAAGSFRLGLETPMSFAQRFGGQLLQDGEIEPPDVTVARLRAVTAADVQRVAARLFTDAKFSLAVVGPSASADRLDAILHGA
ncbi:MAG: insulinase family protein [Dehalococcoidia bacterium]|nr:MAG: insulinase family protein [Dehalococcoidia bacterium]